MLTPNQAVTKYTKVVKATAAKFKHPKVEFEDLIQEGYLGLLTSLDTFQKLPIKRQRKLNLDNYLRTGIFRAISASVNSGSQVKLPTRIELSVSHIAQLKSLFVRHTGLRQYYLKSDLFTEEAFVSHLHRAKTLRGLKVSYLKKNLLLQPTNRHYKPVLQTLKNRNTRRNPIKTKRSITKVLLVRYLNQKLYNAYQSRKLKSTPYQTWLDEILKLTTNRVVNTELCGGSSITPALEKLVVILDSMKEYYSRETMRQLHRFIYTRNFRKWGNYPDELKRAFAEVKDRLKETNS